MNFLRAYAPITEYTIICYDRPQLSPWDRHKLEKTDGIGNPFANIESCHGEIRRALPKRVFNNKSWHGEIQRALPAPQRVFNNTMCNLAMMRCRKRFWNSFCLPNPQSRIPLGNQPNHIVILVFSVRRVELHWRVGKDHSQRRELGKGKPFS